MGRAAAAGRARPAQTRGAHREARKGEVGRDRDAQAHRGAPRRRPGAAPAALRGAAVPVAGEATGLVAAEEGRRVGPAAAAAAANARPPRLLRPGLPHVELVLARVARGLSDHLLHKFSDFSLIIGVLVQQ